MTDIHPGARVQLRYSPEHQATVTRTEPGHWFKVTYDSHGRRSERHPPNRMRVRFAWHDRHLFDPAGFDRARVDHEARVELPAELAEKYGIGR